jgi:hypothetical protein
MASGVEQVRPSPIGLQCLRSRPGSDSEVDRNRDLEALLR